MSLRFFGLLISLLVALSESLNAQDSTRIRVVDVSYSKLDSIIRTNDYTGLYMWPAWCSACHYKMQEVLDILKSRSNIAYYSVNDPDSRTTLSRKQMRDTTIFKGFYRLEYQGRNKLFAINDRSQFNRFRQHFTKDQNNLKNERIQYFMIFNKAGDLIYYNRDHLEPDSIRKALGLLSAK